MLKRDPAPRPNRRRVTRDPAAAGQPRGVTTPTICVLAYADREHLHAVFDFVVSEAMTVEVFVKRIIADGGLFLNQKRSDWIPTSEIRRVWLK